MNDRTASARSKIVQLRQNFAGKLPERVKEALHLAETLKANAHDKDAAVALHRLFQSIKGIANTFAFTDLSTLSAQGEEIANQILNNVPDADEGFWSELVAFLVRFEACAQAVQQLAESREQEAQLTREMLPDVAAPLRDCDPAHLKVLVVDDDNTTRSVLKALLRSEDYQVVGEANNGRDALVMCDSLKPDLVLLDINMPQVNGLHVLAAIRRAQPTVKVIMVSGDAAIDKVCSAINKGAAGFIVKPFNAAVVPDRIAACLKPKGK